MTLTGSILRIDDLTDPDIRIMYELMQIYYDNVAWDDFNRDLRSKSRVILLRSAGVIKGFSTQLLYDRVIDGRAVSILFSGDTIISRDYWRSFALPVTWVRMMRTIKSQNPDRPLYWFLISKGHRTYRFLPTFFKRYFPGVEDGASDFEIRLLARLACEKFGDSFDPATFIVAAADGSQRLRDEMCDISDDRIKNKHVAFFLERNPGYVYGDELACIAEFCESNLTPFILRRTDELIDTGGPIGHAC